MHLKDLNQKSLLEIVIRFSGVISNNVWMLNLFKFALFNDGNILANSFNRCKSPIIK